jgi:hypothetical protein
MHNLFHFTKVTRIFFSIQCSENIFLSLSTTHHLRAGDWVLCGAGEQSSQMPAGLCNALMALNKKLVIYAFKIKTHIKNNTE